MAKNNPLHKEDVLNCSCYNPEGTRQIQTFRRNLLLISVESNLSVKAAKPLETLVRIYRTTRCHIQEYSSL